MASSLCLLDTNILLRLIQPETQQHDLVKRAVDRLWSQYAELRYVSQSLAEFWNVCTRPVERNGLGWTIAETDKRAAIIESQLKLAPDSEAAHRVWRKIVLNFAVSGVQVHDARLVAVMLTHQIGTILTLNGKDFRRYQDIKVVPPTVSYPVKYQFRSSLAGRLALALLHFQLLSDGSLRRHD